MSRLSGQLARRDSVFGTIVSPFAPDALLELNNGADFPIPCCVVSNAIDRYVADATAALCGIGWEHSPAELRRRVELAQQQDWTCTWCEQPLTPEDIGASRTQLDHVIPAIRGGPHASWNKELLHSACNASKGDRMTAKAWDLARRYAVNVVPPDPAALRNGVEAVAGGIRRIRQSLADFDGAGLEPPFDDDLAGQLAEAIASGDRILRLYEARVSLVDP
jgi:hypothetical protein